MCVCVGGGGGGSCINLPERLQVALDVAVGVGYLHSLESVHRDIKLKNVLVSCREKGFGGKTGIWEGGGQSSMNLPDKLQVVVDVAMEVRCVHSMGLVCMDKLKSVLVNCREKGAG